VVVVSVLPLLILPRLKQQKDCLFRFIEAVFSLLNSSSTYGLKLYRFIKYINSLKGFSAVWNLYQKNYIKEEAREPSPCFPSEEDNPIRKAKKGNKNHQN
jgi:hypothetical protein